MYRDITIDEAMSTNNACYIDLRSENEYAEDRIPGAINVPLFNNEERARIGTVYKQVSVEEAKKLGLEIAGSKLSKLYQQIKEYSKGKILIVYCWRGGMRSQFVASVLSSMGLPVRRIVGGYKAYRKQVYSYLYNVELPHNAVVLHGLTGVGKTHILERLEAMGAPVLDLENLAANRGSVYGKINMPPSPSQKLFETKLAEKLKSFEKVNYFFVECESRRLGRLYVPPAVYKKINTGCRVLLYASLSTRVKRIIADYTGGENKNIRELQESTAKLAKYLGKNKVEELNQMLEQQEFEAVFTYLLTKYYDPLYKYPQQPDNNYDCNVDCENLDLAAEKIFQHFKAKWGCDVSGR
ncbi:tRNA 2-selenouridine synthase [Desulfohalotomaculum tongense]|uniref:tRNA 2-selenouridine(34) synthase MnmH n=1 Tax=Desulforadius tongensis TaxID=1216062 RepID=UPI001958DF9A|nr:tRNA 2-selenouridine(34) synthase MnmH [Desulforadius tongensis]MBM7854467.1 tRNA 2-selenouridine synthase [Desulforadius tongensis]